MSVMLDLIGSAVIAAFVILMGLRLNQSIAGNADASAASLNVQEGMSELVQSIEFDFRKIGYDMVRPQYAIRLADSTHIKILGNFDNDASGSIDSIEWYLGPQLTSFPNPNIHVLYRKFNEQTPVGTMGIGVTKFLLRYYDQQGVPVTNPAWTSRIWVIEISLQVESPYKVQNQIDLESTGYAAAYWRQARLSSRNLHRHG